jgi:acetyl-CoA carboxylase biotin carboxyl carrier protein
MDFEIIKKVIKIAEESDISGLAVEKGDFRVEVKREKGIHHIPIAPAHQIAHAALQAEAGAAEKEEEGLSAVTSPMVGTFYRAPSPDSDPYVEVGDEIEKGKAICIIEAMKLFNEIESEVSGKVAKILVENGSPVEYGQKLMLVKKK